MKKYFALGKNRGFTLIELLVVIAIIGILVAIIAVSVVSMRAHGRDSTILHHLGQIKTHAEMVYSSTGGYSVICDGSGGLNINPPYDGTLGVIKQEVEKYNGSITCYADTENYCVQSSLNINVNDHFCLDSSGFSRVISSPNCAAGNIRCQ